MLEFESLKEPLTIGHLKKIIADLPDEMIVVRPGYDAQEHQVKICQVRDLCHGYMGRLSDADGAVYQPVFKGLAIY